MNNFFETPEPKSNKTVNYNILVYPNITFQDNLEKDSYIAVLRSALPVLNTIRDDIHFVLLLPDYVNSLQMPNVSQQIFPMPSYPNTMRCQFDAKRLINIVKDLDMDFDIVWSHLPEHTLQLKNVFVNSLSVSPRFIGYCHWYEVPENTLYHATMLLANLAGTLEMETCGVNSDWLKELVLEKARAVFSPTVVTTLGKILETQYLGSLPQCQPARKIPKSIIFNHRANSYTGWDRFIALMDQLYKKRQDFTVYVTLATDTPRPYIKTLKSNSYKDYLTKLSSMSVGVGMFTKYSAWSLSTTDGLSMGVPYLLPYKLCFPEMVGRDYPLFYSNDKEFLSKLEDCLDSNEQTMPGLRLHSWANTVKKWNNNWSLFIDNNWRVVGDGDGYNKVIDTIKSSVTITPSELRQALGWGMNISLSTYRNKLRTDERVRLIKNGYEWIG